MKNILKSIVLIAFLFLSCSKNDNVENVLINDNYPYIKQVGYSANDILSDKIFKNIYFEVMYVDGFKPTDNTLNNLKSFIESRTYKTAIVVETRLIDISLKSIYSMDDVRNIEDANKTMFTDENLLVISALFLNGNSSSNTDTGVVLGTAYRNTSFVMFEETIHSFSDSPFEPSREVLESTVMLHEFCHLLGLVNIGTNMVEDHQDTEHGAHCTDQNCLMYYQVENGKSIKDMIVGGAMPQLDLFCLEDLKANGGR
ncbi:MAG: membrane metalloprotease [Lutibacter sp.]|uniref:membrane metalloprotease n=1 Tax=Lutibacter sp. TaxID=1925666 RepID=UPI0017FA00A9|nr:membrane metalloprotease [Lutibacter sp.]MBT8317721.1 membrane metalloprotease [Lutibacter sp.]NNJ58579.1 membrane metalloprotease [Lutibacter sp.]